MKRQREEEDHAVTTAASYQSPLRLTAPRGAWGHGHAHGHASTAASTAAEITPTKRQRDRSIPMDAMSRLMTAATSAARMKKRAQMTLTSLFGASSSTATHAKTKAVAMGCCAVCAAAPLRTKAKATATAAQMQRCAHCERAIGACCARECDGCANAFCSLCSTINCDEQYDRVFCLSCNYDLSR